MDEIKIEKDIPVPMIWGRKYPFNQMEIGDSFFIEIKTPHSFSQSTKPLRDKGWGFTTRKENGGVRIWRYK